MNPKALCLGSSPNFVRSPHSHGNISFFNKQERREEIKRELFTYGELPVLIRCSPEVQEHHEALMPSSAPPSGKPTRMGTSPTTKTQFATNVR